MHMFVVSIFCKFMAVVVPQRYMGNIDEIRKMLDIRSSATRNTSDPYHLMKFLKGTEAPPPVVPRILASFQKGTELQC